MKKTFIVLISVHNDNLDNPRGFCEYIENIEFKMESISTYNVKKEVESLLLEETGVCDDGDVEVEAMTDFMDRVNDEEFEQSDYFMTYVRVVTND